MSVEKKSKLTEKQLSILESEMQKNRKSVGIAYLLWFFLGSLGVHKFYLGDTKKGLLYLVLGIFGWISMFTGGLAALGGSSGGGFFAVVGTLCILALGILLLIDLFTIPSQIKKAEEQKEEEIIDYLLSTNAVTSSEGGEDKLTDLFS